MKNTTLNNILLCGVILLIVSGCTNPFGGSSLIEMSSVEINWSNKDFDFGDQQIGSSSVKTFIISNNGNSDATDCGNVRLSDQVNFGIVSQTCTSPVLPAGTQCEVAVESHPQTAGEKNLIIDRQCRIKSNVISLVNQVRVTAVLPTAQWTPTNHTFGSIATNQNTFTKTFILSNQGTSTIANCGLVSLSNSTDFSIINDTCGVNDLGLGTSCEITVLGRPSSAGIKRATLSRTCESSFTFSTTTDQITTEGFDSFWGLYSPTINLGDTEQGQFAAGYVYFLNESFEVPVSCTAASVVDTTNFIYSYDDCGTRGLTAWEGCTVGVQTHPSAAIGEHVSSLIKTCTFADSSVKTLTIPVRANILAPTPNLSVNSYYNYGDTYVGGTGSDSAFQFYNAGNLAVSGCGQPTLSNSADFTIVTNNCNGADIGASTYCDVTVRSTPQTTGIKTSSLSLTCSVGGTVTATVEQNAKPSAPDLAVSPANYNYGSINVGSNSDATFNFNNQGPLAGTGCSAAVLSNTTDFAIHSDACLTNDIASSGTCAIVVRVAPGSVGSKTTTLTRTCSVGGSVVSNISATGYVTAPDLAWATMANDYGDVLSGENSLPIYFYLNNNGNASATSCSAPSLTDTTNFTIIGESCGTNDLSQGNSCYVAIQANPQSLGIHTATLSRTCGAGGTISTTTNGIQVKGIPFVDWQQKYGNHSFGDVRLTSESSEHTYFFRNMNSSSLNNCTTPTLVNYTDFAITSTDCTNTMAPTAFCEVKVRARPTSLGTKASTLTRSCTESGAVNLSLNVNGINEGVSVQIATSQNYGCTLLDSGMVKCWGAAVGGGVFSDEFPFPTTVSGISDAVQLTSNQNEFCAVINDGTVKCWYTPNSVTTQAGITNVKTITLGENFKCALMQDDTVQCWGTNWLGQLGDGTYNGSSTPVMVSGIGTAKSVTSGTHHACALLSDNTVKCWGYNGAGSIGDGTTTDRTTAVAITNLGTSTVELKAGSSYTCAVLSDKTVKCWGANDDGRLGLGHTTNTPTPTLVPGLSNVDHIYLGYDWNGTGQASTCAQMSDGSVKCWGVARGNGYATNKLTPQPMPGLSNIATLSTGKFSYGCAITTTSKVQCWGYNYYGNLGYGSRHETNSRLPTAVVLPKAVRNFAVATSAGARCYVYTDDSVSCVGRNTYGHLGDGTTNDSLINHVVPTGITAAKSISSDGITFCAILTDDTVKCWGNGYYYYGLSPMTMTTSAPPIQISGGWGFYCALLNDGRVECWGKNSSGELGDGLTPTGITPVLVSGITNATHVSAGQNTGCAIVGTGAIKCWGSGYQGALGEGVSSGSILPVGVFGITNAVKMKSAQDGHSCAVLADSTVKCWGYNSRGQLGNGSYGGSSNYPVVVTGLTGVTDVSVSYEMSCALMGDTTLKCWGNNIDGTFGENNGSNLQLVPSLRMNSFNTTMFANSYGLGSLSSTSSDMQIVDSLYPNGYDVEPVFDVNGL